MCGIAGIVSCTTGRAVEPETIERMIARLRHRGPDDSGLHLDREFGVGVRRLSIIDLASGHQPMVNEARTVAVAFNGEIYNHHELREELTRKGYAFRTRSDTEVVLRSYEAYGLKCFDSLYGMFAVALWDARTRELALARDRLGIKPLFYAPTRDGVVFASELKALLASGQVERAVNLRSLSNFLAVGYTPGPDSILETVSQVPPGHYARVTRQGIEVVEWWALPFQTVRAGRRRDCEAALASLLDRAVQRHLISDVPVGVLLSGGLDSSSLLSLMQARSPYPIKTFTVAFEEGSFNEGPEARATAAALHTEHHEVVCRPAYVRDNLTAIVQATDNLLANPAAIPLHQVTKLAGGHVKVLLSGNGGDEVFAGYPTYLADRLLPWYHRVPRVLHDEVLRPLVRSLPASFGKLTWEFKLKQFMDGAMLPPERAHYAWRVIFTDDDQGRLFLQGPDRGDPFEAFGRAFQQTAGEPDFLNRAIHCDLKTWLPDMGLLMFDNIGMANSVEIRVPYLDHELVEYCMRLPTSLKMPGLRLKHLLKRVMTPRLPRGVLRRRKAGFHVPLAPWFCGELRDLVLDILSPQAVRRIGYFRPDVVDALCREHLARRRDHSWRLWNLVCFFVWHEAFLTGR